MSDRFKSQLNSKLKSAKCCKSGDMEHADHVITILRSWYNSIYNMNMYIYICIHVIMIPQPIQWEFQDPKMEVLYHIRPKFVGIFPYIGLIYPYIW